MEHIPTWTFAIFQMMLLVERLCPKLNLLAPTSLCGLSLAQGLAGNQGGLDRDPRPGAQRPTRGGLFSHFSSNKQCASPVPWGNPLPTSGLGVAKAVWPRVTVSTNL